MKRILFHLTLLLMGLILVLVTLTVEGAADPTTDITSLKPGPGREHVLANCMPCHSTALVAANHMDRDGWDRTITKMQERNGMWPLGPEVRKGILDYLEVAQRIPDQDLEAGKKSPWASPLYRPNPIW